MEDEITRRDVLETGAVAFAGASLPALPALAQKSESDRTAGPAQVTLRVNGRSHSVPLEPRVTLLDALRERLDLVGTKKGCDIGACGACTVLVEGRRVLACITLAARVQGREVTTIEGIARGGELHPLQAAFIEHDAIQCGYCTPGQIMSGVACIREGRAGSPEEIRANMSGNLCRCGAYPNIVAAIAEVAGGGRSA